MEFVSLNELENLTGLSETTISRLERKGSFPRRVKISARRIAWLKHDVQSWIESVATNNGIIFPAAEEISCDSK